MGIIFFVTASPSARTITIAPLAAQRTTKIDPTRAKAAFEEQLAKYRAAGQPLRPEDLTPPPVEPGRNAATSFAQAIAILDQFDVPSNRVFFNLNVQLTMPADKWHVVDDALSKPLAPLLVRVDEATTRPACVWDIKYTSPIFRTLLLHLNGMRGVADIVRSAALSAHRAGTMTWRYVEPRSSCKWRDALINSRLS